MLPLFVPMVEHLEDEVPLDMHVGSRDVGAADRHVHVGRPVAVVPLHVDAVVGLHGGGQAAVVVQGALPLDRDVPVAVEGGGHAVAVVELLRQGQLLVVHRRGELDARVVDLVVDLHLLAVGGGGELDARVFELVRHHHLLAVGRGGELDVGGVVVVPEHDVSLLVRHVVARVDGDPGAVHVHSLGGLDGLDGSSAAAGGGGEADGEVGIGVVGVDLHVSGAEILGVDVGAGGHAPSRNVGLDLSPDGLWQGGEVAGGSDVGLDSVADVEVAVVGGSLPRERRVQSVDAVEVAILDGNGKLRATSMNASCEKGKVGNGELHVFF
mmetsp:Transcript_13286/g.38263  ORF Transcript_13286/g.38263 Transcript_13286/m.38263 type:complete len:324 (+) Transcript_13286:291-1262(+)